MTHLAPARLRPWIVAKAPLVLAYQCTSYAVDRTTRGTWQLARRTVYSQADVIAWMEGRLGQHVLQGEEETIRFVVWWSERPDIAPVTAQRLTSGRALALRFSEDGVDYYLRVTPAYQSPPAELGVHHV